MCVLSYCSEEYIKTERLSLSISFFHHFNNFVHFLPQFPTGHTILCKHFCLKKPTKTDTYWVKNGQNSQHYIYLTHIEQNTAGAWHPPAVCCLFLQSIWLKCLLRYSLKHLNKLAGKKKTKHFLKSWMWGVSITQRHNIYQTQRWHNRQTNISSHLKQKAWLFFLFLFCFFKVMISCENQWWTQARLAMTSLFWTDGLYNRKVRGQSLLSLQITLGCYKMLWENLSWNALRRLELPKNQHYRHQQQSMHIMHSFTLFKPILPNPASRA